MDMTERVQEIFNAVGQARTDNASFETSFKEKMLCDDVTEEDVRAFMMLHWSATYATLEFVRSFISMLKQKGWLWGMKEIVCAWLKYCIHSHEEIGRVVVEMAADDDGFVRYVGKEVWDGIDYTIDILEESVEMQMRLGISLLQDLSKPKERLHIVLPLLKSQEEEVRKVVERGIMFHVLNYPGVVRECLNEFQLGKTQELEAIEKQLEAEEERYKYGRECIELRAAYAYPEEYDLCWRVCNEKHRKEMEDVRVDAEKNSILGLISNVIIGRGMGWRDKEGNCHKLMSISYEVPKPMFISSMTPIEEWEYHNQVFRNWAEIKNEQN